ncbi:protein trichome birefringence-like 4 [Telopea speciosissima]|uniref:protein trichome birefringence-like 4 n=1 Tax=Telopea speciosissima TaxID=54955 RepID=UPI001CC772C2|nr:protein trichome birefringence-like 4 [Telopea speciosissima]
MANVPVELSRNIPCSLSRSRSQRYVTIVFILALFLLVAAILTKNSPAAAASNLASRLLSRSGSTFYFYPTTTTTTSSLETHIESPPNPQSNHSHVDSNITTTTASVVHNNTNSSSDGKAPNSRKTKIPPQLPKKHSDVNVNVPSPSPSPSRSSPSSPSPLSSPSTSPLSSSLHSPSPLSSPSTSPLSSPSPATSPSPAPAMEVERSKTDVVKDMKSCDIFDGNWVVDNGPPAYQPGSCAYVEEAFNCFENGRVEDNFLRYRWQPRRCQIPRLDGKEMLDMLRGKRLVFVGDSLNRNMWESLVCFLREFVMDKKTVFEISGRVDFKTQGFDAFRFEEYNCSVEFIRSPFLVEEWEFTDNKTGARKETLRLDQIEESKAFKYQHADVLIFNTAHWWTHPKTTEGKDYYQEGNRVYSKLQMTEAYTKALHTWSKWIDANIDANKTTVFFRGYSSSHFQGGQWNSGGSCEFETTPITNDSYLKPYPEIMNVLESVLGEMRTPVLYLNITRMTNYRKDAHPAIFRDAQNHRQPGMIQDCSHWCLPGVPDVWNQMLYALLLTTHHNPQYNSS